MINIRLCLGQRDSLKAGLSKSWENQDVWVTHFTTSPALLFKKEKRKPGISPAVCSTAFPRLMPARIDEDCSLADTLGTSVSPVADVMATRTICMLVVLRPQFKDFNREPPQRYSKHLSAALVFVSHAPESRQTRKGGFAHLQATCFSARTQSLPLLLREGPCAFPKL